MRYLAAAERTGDWLLATANRTPQGWSWPVQPGVSDQVDPGLGWGTAAPVMFFVEAFRTTGAERWLSAAQEGTRWMDAHLDAAAADWAGCGLLTGIGGWAVVLHELAAAAASRWASIHRTPSCAARNQRWSPVVRNASTKNMTGAAVPQPRPLATVPDTPGLTGQNQPCGLRSAVASSQSPVCWAALR